VESWLGAVEGGMRLALKAEARRCVREYAQLPGMAIVGEASLGPEVSSGLASGWVGGTVSEPGVRSGGGGGGMSAAGGQARQGREELQAGGWGLMSRGQWALHQPAQLAIVISNVFWCHAAEAALEAAAAGDVTRGAAAGASLGDLERRCGEQLEDMIRLVRGGLTELQRRVSGFPFGAMHVVPSSSCSAGRLNHAKSAHHLEQHQGLSAFRSLAAIVWSNHCFLQPHAPDPTPCRQSAVALITIDVHNRDVARHLAEARAASPADFAWQARLRYEFDRDTDMVVVRHVSARWVCNFWQPWWLWMGPVSGNKRELILSWSRAGQPVGGS
jgi:hypothetical protein